MPPESSDGRLDIVSRRAAMRSSKDLRVMPLLADDSGDDACGEATRPTLGAPI